jgi:hypothetical protein
VTKGRTLARSLGALLAGAGALVPPIGIATSLDPAATGARLEQLVAGAWFAKALLAFHGVWLFAAASRLDPASRAAPLWEPPPASRELAGPRANLVFGALLCTAALLRWIGIHGDLWLDEVFALVDYLRLPLGQSVTSYPDDNQHLLYSILAHVTVAALGENAAALRLPALLLGLASLWATLRLASLVVGRREALLVVALLTFSYHHVWFSQNARAYTGLLFATALSTELLLRALWRGRWSLWLAYAVSAALGMGFHLTMIFTIGAHALVVAALGAYRHFPSPGRARPWLGFLLAGTLTLQLFALLLPQLFDFFLRPSAGVTTAAVPWKSPLWLVAETLRGLAFGWPGVLAGGILLGAGVWSLWVRAPLATICFALPGALGVVTMIALDRNLWPRFFFNELAFAAIFAVRGACELGSRLATRLGHTGPHWGTALAVAVVTASALTLPRGYRLPKQDFTGAHDFVLRQQRPGDRVVGIDLAGRAYRSYYAPGMPVAHTLEELEALSATEGRTWILYTLGGFIASTRPALWDAIQTRYEEVRAFPGTVGDGAIVVRRSLEKGATSSELP